jgi:hypothetical protein
MGAHHSPGAESSCRGKDIFFAWELNFYVSATFIMYLSDFCRFLLCTCGWERRGERGAGEVGGGGARERGIECM